MSISQNFPNVVPSLNLNFVRSKKLDPRITFDRSTTATRMNSLGLIETVSANVPRFDHSYNSSTTSVNSLGLLIESQRTNLLQYSQAPATSPWQIFNNGGSSIVNNSATAPDGTTTAGLFTCGTNQDSIYQDVGSISGTGTYTLSVFVKGGTSNYISFAGFFLYNTTPNFAQVGFNPITGQVVSSTSGTNIQVQAYPNGWYRLSVTGTGTNALNTAIRYQIYSVPGTVYIWGAQAEAGLFSTSYIPTTNAQVTRNADYASITGTNFSNLFNNTEGTARIIYQKSYQQANFDLPLYPTLFCFNGWPSRILYADFGGQYQEMNVVVSTVFQASMYGSSNRPTNTTLKFAGAYKENNFAAMGTERVLYTDNSGSLPTVNAAFIGNENLASSTPLNGHIAQILYYPKRLTNTQLQEITK